MTLRGEEGAPPHRLQLYNMMMKTQFLEQDVQNELSDVSGIRFNDEIPPTNTMASEPGLSAAQLSMISDNLPDAVCDGAQVFSHHI